MSTYSLNIPFGKVGLAKHPGILVSEFTPNELSGINICFVNMPLREASTPNTPPQGPGLMAARLRKYGAVPTIIDLNAYRIKDSVARARGLLGGRHLSFDETEKLLSDHFHTHGEPAVVAFSGLITTLRWQKQVAKIVRRLIPETFLLSGGGLATEVRHGLFSWIPELDAIAHSEGDDIVLIIARDVKVMREKKNSRAMLTSQNPYFIGEFANRDRFVYDGNRPTDLDILPVAAWDLLHEDVWGNPILEWYIRTPVWGSAAGNSSAAPFTMERSMTTVSSRGCPYACAFCYRGAQGERNYGMRSVEALGSEVQWLIEKYNVDFVGFPDDNFAVDPKRCQKLPEAFKDLAFRWGTHTRLDEATPSRIGPMAESGCVYIGFGAESASPNTLTRMNKGGFILKRGLTTIGDYQFPTTMIDGIKNCRELGIHSNCTWILGYPGETLYDLKTSVAFILWQKDLYTEGFAPGTRAYTNALDSVNEKMFTATAYPGTAMFKDPTAKILLSKHFGISFDEKGEPSHDDALELYIEELDDATKILTGKSGEPLNFGDMSLDAFLEAREYVDSGSIEKILDM